MRKFEEHGLTLNYEKCVIGAKSMEYMGEVLTGEGLQISKKKLLLMHRDLKINPK